MSEATALTCEVRSDRTDEIYEVTFRRDGRTLIVLCTCPAAENGLHCKHRLRLLKGDPTGLQGGAAAVARQAAALAAGSNIEPILRAYLDTERALDRAKKARTAAAARLGKALIGRLP